MRYPFKTNKYSNIKTKIGDDLFDSKKESERFITLKLLERAGRIENLKLQPKFKFEINGKPLKSKTKGSKQVTYTADFSYFDVDKGVDVVEDVKSAATKKLYAFKIKKALFETIYDMELTIT